MGNEFPDFPLTKLSPSEMFLGRPAWKIELVPEPNTFLSIQDWILGQIEIQDQASKRLQKIRETSLKFANRKRVPSTFKENDYVLVHNRRWPQRRFPKLASPWQGPFKILKARFNSLQVMASPSLGGVIDVPLDMCKRWELNFDDELLIDPEFSDDPEILPPKPSENDVMDEDKQAELGIYNVM